jgi:protein SCO1/2
MKTLRLIRYGAWALVAAAAIVAAALFLGPSLSPRDDAVTIGGPFALVDQNGATVTEAALKGHPSLIYFGYTFCPDVCPTTLFDAANWMKELGPDADKLQFYFVTVDPERDTREVIAEYLTAFDSRMIGLTGSRQAVDKALSAFRIYSRKVPGENGGNYTMDHNASVYMFDAEGRFAGAIAYQEPEGEVLPKIRKLIAGS